MSDLGQTKVVNVGSMLGAIQRSLQTFLSHNFKDYAEEVNQAGTTLRSFGAMDMRTVYRGIASDGEMHISYWREGKRGLLRFTSRGQITDILTGRTATISAEVAALVMAMVFGAEEIKGTTPFGLDDEPFYLSAARYANCLQSRTEKECASVLEQSEIDRITADAQLIWRPVDAFLAEAKEAEANATHLATLEQIVWQYRATRPVGRPLNIDAAYTILGASIMMTKDFKESPALQSIISTNGLCTKWPTGSGPCTSPYAPPNAQASYFTTRCFFGGYTDVTDQEICETGQK